MTERCMGCMEVLPEGTARCAGCGYMRGTVPESPLHLLPGTELHGQYVIGRVLGHGGFGITYLGWDKNLERKLAVKEFFPGGVAVRGSNQATVAPFNDQQRKDFEYGLERYLEEARMLARFNNHPNILAVLNFFRENGTAYMVTEFLEGITLEEHIARSGGRISFEGALALLVPVMKALEDVHAAGILHRDVSPDNIHVGRQVKLLDFGAARIAMGERSRNLSVILKEGYAPPEQYRTKGNQGPWTDVYAVAATLYRAITGKHVPAALDRMGEDELKPPMALGCAMTLREEEAILKALSYNWQDRFQTMAEFRERLMAPTGGVVTGSGAVTVVTPRYPTGQSIAETPTVVVGTGRTGGAPVAVPVTVGEGQPKGRVPVWVWSVVGGIAVLAILIGLRPKAETAVPEVKEQATLPAPTVAPPTSPATGGDAGSKVRDGAAAAQETPAAVKPDYEGLLRQAEAAAEEPAVAEKLLKEALGAAPERPEGHDLMAQLQMYKLKNYGQAEASYRKAQELGGGVTFHVVLLRRAEDGPNRKPGRLRITKERFSYEDTESAFSFVAPRATVVEFKRNREVGRFFKGKLAPQGLFHLRLANGGHFNFVGRSEDKEKERDLILALGGEQ